MGTAYVEGRYLRISVAFLAPQGSGQIRESATTRPDDASIYGKRVLTTEPASTVRNRYHKALDSCAYSEQAGRGSAKL